MNSPALRKTWEGQVVDGKFPLRQWLGSSDHSVVFLTELVRSLQKAAIKLIPANTLNVDQLARWRPALRLSHPHLLRLFDMGRCELEGVQLLYLVMEYAEEDLSEILPQRPLTPAETGEFLPPTLDALSYLHEKGFVHTDIKPSNILAADNQLKLSTDRLYPAGQSSDKARALSVYEAPELAIGAVTPAADVWSLGITLVEALTQRPPIPSAIHEPAVPGTIPEPLSAIARACLRRDPRQRVSITNLKRMLQPGSLPASPTPKARAERKGLKWRVLLPVIAAVILVALLAPVLRRRQPAEAESKVEQVRTPPKASPNATVIPKPTPTTPPSKPAAQPNKPTSSRGEVAQQVLPDVPRSARNTIQGKIRVTVRVDVDPSGKVTEATLTSAGPSPYFAKLALNAARRWEFTPPQVGGQPAPSAWLLRFRFGNTSTDVSPVPADH